LRKIGQSHLPQRGRLLFEGAIRRDRKVLSDEISRSSQNICRKFPADVLIAPAFFYRKRKEESK
jgi:hypothetical protein